MQSKSIRATLALLMLFGVVLLTSPHEQAEAAQTADKPNVVLIDTDDMADSDLKYMPVINKLLKEQGVEFKRAFVTYSLCCPSRSTILRGQYPHNHGVVSNSPPEGALQRFRGRGLEKDNLATWMDNAGYQTVHLGKYLNSYGAAGMTDEAVPPGWDYWNTLWGPYHIKPKFNNNGTVTSYPKGVVLDQIIERKANYYIRNLSKNEPMYMQIDTHSPHGPLQYPPKYAGMFKNVKAPRYPSFNERDVSDKPAWIKQKKRLSGKTIDSFDEHYRERLRSLQVVDDVVGTTVKALRESGKLDNTYIIFMSDNGYHFGEHRLEGKWTSYLESHRIPLIVRGPNVPKNRDRGHYALNNDIAPTIASLGGARIPGYVDGSSLVPAMRSNPPSQWRKRFLYESWRDEDYAPSPPTLKGVKTNNFTYTHYYTTKEDELYNLRQDPFQMQNRWRGGSPKVKSRMRNHLYDLARCEGGECRKAEGFAP